MRGAPWDGLFYGFVLEGLVAVGALVLALGTPDFLTRAVAWLVLALVIAAAARTVRKAVRTEDGPERPVGRGWFGG